MVAIPHFCRVIFRLREEYDLPLSSAVLHVTGNCARGQGMRAFQDAVRKDSRLGWGGRWRRWVWRFGGGEAEGVVDGFEQEGHVEGLVNIGDGAGFESGIAIADGSARAEDDDGNGAGVDEHLKALHDDETVASGNAEIENDEVGLLLAGGADGGETVAGGDDFKTGGLEAASESGELDVFILDD